MIAVISDVHGNLPALTAVLEAIDARDVRRIWCLGDTVGYGPYVNECVQLVVQRCELVLAGNHDLVVRGDVDDRLFGGTALAGVQYARTHLTPENLALLAPLTASKALDQVELYHASANDPVWEYVRDIRSATGHLATQRAPLSFVGHSHVQLTYLQPGDADVALGGSMSDGDVLDLPPDAKAVVNPGSVGQPRDRDPRAAFALVDDGRVAFHRVPYDIPTMRRAVEAAGLPGEIGERLELGW